TATPRVRQIGWFLFFGTAVTTVMIWLGQIGWVLTLPVTLLWLAARREQWGRCGLWFGLLVGLKPFFLLFAPYFLLRGQPWVMLTGLATALGIVVACIPIFGLENYRAWVACLGPADSWGWQEMNASLWAVMLRVSTENPLYASAVQISPAGARVIWLLV